MSLSLSLYYNYTPITTPIIAIKAPSYCNTILSQSLILIFKQQLTLWTNTIVMIVIKLYTLRVALDRAKRAL